MNKVIQIGRLAHTPEIRYSKSDEPVCIANFQLAVKREFRREGEPEADFFRCVAYGKTGEFVEKYIKKGLGVVVEGHLKNRSWDGNDGKKRWATEIIVEKVKFNESKASFELRNKKNEADKSVAEEESQGGFYPVDEDIDEDLPF